MVAVYDVGVTKYGEPYIVMEFLHGGSLADMIGDGKASGHRARYADFHSGLQRPLARAQEGSHPPRCETLQHHGGADG